MERATPAQRFEQELARHGRRLERHGELFRRLRAAAADAATDDDAADDDRRPARGDRDREPPVSARSTRAAQGTGHTGDSAASEVGFVSPRRRSRFSIGSVLRAAADGLDLDEGPADDGEREHIDGEDDDVDSLVTSIRSLTARYRSDERLSVASSRDETDASEIDDASHDRDLAADIDEEDFVTAHGFSETSSLSTTQTARQARSLKQALAERLAALEQEESLVRAHLRRLGNAAGAPRASPHSRQTPGQSATLSRPAAQPVPARLERALLVEGPGDGSAAGINEVLAPILEEHFELANCLRRGAAMRAVLVRGRKASDPHLCTEVFVRLNATLDTLCWTLREEDDLLDRNRETAGSSTPIFRLPLKHLSAIFCGGPREERAMSAPSNTIFRLHVARNGVMPVQFAASSAAARQTWVAGLGLFAQLFAEPSDFSAPSVRP